jgi:valyl-tRNA synthetase
VLDTWFDSSNTPLWILEYGRDDPFFQKHAPCSLRPQGKEIVRTWLYYSVLKAFLLTGKTIFRDAWINYHILDEKGYKMSKSAGNVISPQKILDEFGAEPFRLWAASEGNLEKTDFACSATRIAGQSKTLNKLVNLCRLIAQYPFDEKAARDLQPEDEWILAELDRLVALSREHFESYDFFQPVSQIKYFVWEVFASHYAEMTKARAYNNDSRFSRESQAAAVWTLRHCLLTTLELLAPVLPFASLLLYREMTGRNVHQQAFPSVAKPRVSPFSVAEVMDLNAQIWQEKRAKGLALNVPLDSFSIPQKFEPLVPALKEMHKIGKIEWA